MCTIIAIGPVIASEQENHWHGYHGRVAALVEVFLAKFVEWWLFRVTSFRKYQKIQNCLQNFHFQVQVHELEAIEGYFKVIEIAKVLWKFL